MDFETYRSNVIGLPAMVESLAKELKLSTIEPFLKLGIGYIPIEDAWVFPLRNEIGDLIGLLKRTPTGKKLFIKGSKIGYFYSLNPNWKPAKYTSGAYNWLRVSESNPCPVCGKTDWCLVSQDNHAAICPRTPTKIVVGEAGYLHILGQSENAVLPTEPILRYSDYPILITEGVSDWAAATELGFEAVGKQSAQMDTTNIVDLVKGRDVVIIGDNDEAGRRGAEATFIILNKSKACKSVKKIFPPEHVKDLRLWYTEFNCTVDILLQHINTNSIEQYSSTVLFNEFPLDMGHEWLKQVYTQNNIHTLRNYKSKWVRFYNGCYREIDTEELRGQLYEFLEDKVVIQDGKLVQVKPTRNKISDIIDALNRWCYIKSNPPCWLGDDDNEYDPVNLINFRNGILDVNSFIKGDINFMPSNPRLFTLNQIPHDFNPDAKCPLTEDTLWDIVGQEEDKYNSLWQWLGYNFTTDMSMEKLMLLVGRPRSGKGTYISLLETVLGDEQFTITGFGSLCGQFGLASLMGKLCAIMPDARIPTNVDAGVAMEKLKQITGGDSASINRKFRDELPAIHLTCKFTIAVNTIPELPDHARALESRLLVLPFRESYIGREDRTLKTRLKQEAEGIIMRGLHGLRELRTSGEFIIPDDSKKLMNEFSLITTPMAQFVNECCYLGSDHSINKYELYDCWRSWARQNGFSPGSQSHFSQRLLSLYIDIFSEVVEKDERTIPIFFGLTLNTWGRSLVGA